MGSRDDHFIDDERADVLMRRLLARAGEVAPAPSPPDLVTRTTRRLPTGPPALVAMRAARRRMLRIAIGTAVLGAVVLVALVGLAGIVSGNPRLALIFGDGTGGLSRTLLMLHLLAKPIVRVIGAAGAPLLLASTCALLAGGWLWWRLLPAPAYVYAENNRR
jgi:hypothetical protein